MHALWWSNWIPQADDEEAAHLLGARLAATPAADKVHGCGAHADACHVCIVVICQLIGQTGPLWLLTSTLQPNPCHISNKPDIPAFSGVPQATVRLKARCQGVDV